MKPVNNTNFRCHSRLHTCTDPRPPRRCFFLLLESMIGLGPRASRPLFSSEIKREDAGETPAVPERITAHIR
jgi:hypothetical protein